MATKRIVINPDQKLTPEIWAKMEREILIDKVPVKRVANQYGFSLPVVKRRLEDSKANGFRSLKTIVTEKVEAEKKIIELQQEIKDLPMARQFTAKDLEKKLLNISFHLTSAAEQGAATAHRASILANEAMEAVGQIGDTEFDLSHLATVAMLTETANESAKIGLGLLNANKGNVNKPDEPTRRTLADFYRTPRLNN